MKNKVKRVVQLVCIAILLIPVVFFLVKTFYVPKQAVRDGSTWSFKGYATDEGVGNATAVDISLSQEYYIIYSPAPNGDWSDYIVIGDYLTCEDGVIKHHHYIGKESTGVMVNGGYIYKDYDEVVEEIGTYNGKKIEFYSDKYSDAYVRENVMYFTYTDNLLGEELPDEIIDGFSKDEIFGEIQLQFELKE